MANSFLSSWKKYTIYKWKHEQKHYTDHSLVFGKQKKKKSETLFSPQSHKPWLQDFKK